MKEDDKPVTDVPPRELRKKLKQQEIVDTVAGLPRVKKASKEIERPRINRVRQLRKGRPAKFNVFKKI